MSVEVFDSSDQVVLALAESLKAYSLQEKPVHISLSGGSTPKQLFRFIANSNYANEVQWQNLHFWWGDERCVGPDDAESNYGEANTLLFQHIHIPRENIHRIRGEAEPERERERFDKELQRHLPAKLGRPQFDWIILGVGNDGHTASLFPGQTDYASEQNVIVAKHPETGQLRLSLSAPVIRVAKRVSYLVLGEGKAKIIREIQKQEGAYQTYPAANIESKEGQTEWYLDRLAAAELK